MNSSNSKSPSPVRERRRTPMACTNCRSRKLKCRPVESVDSAPCERCVKDGCCCEYRPVDTSSASNNQTSNYTDNPVILYPVHSAPPPNQDSALPVHHPFYPNQGGGYVPDSTFNPAMQPPFQNPHYSTPSHQLPPYPVQQYTNTFPSGYPADQSNYHSSSQFLGHPQYTMPYQPAHGQGNGSFDHRAYQFTGNGYENQNVHGTRE